ncbi:hypothetical protein BSKO_00497 [Bryopsis sp. KO-2023]|nr:hypothetical protein BSKO_00497 [Bryopsis sp. KO-2023]
MLAKRFLSLVGSRSISETVASIFIRGCATSSELPPYVQCQPSPFASVNGYVDVLHWNRDNLSSGLSSPPAQEWSPIHESKMQGGGVDAATSMFPLLHVLGQAPPSIQTDKGEQPEMFADSTKRKRKKKMNKHKHRKRIKKLRHQKKK